MKTFELNNNEVTILSGAVCNSIKDLEEGNKKGKFLEQMGKILGIGGTKEIEKVLQNLSRILASDN